MLSIEELLKPRYKLLADYPGNTYPIGFVFGDPDTIRWHKSIFEKYPHLFKEIPWYEERKPEDMPEYIKINECDEVLKVLDWEGHIGILIQLPNYVYKINLVIEKCLPATKEEYETYINQNKKEAI